MTGQQPSPEEQYRRLRDPERWIGVVAPSMPGRSATTPSSRSHRGIVVAQVLVAAAVVVLAAAVIVAARSVVPVAPPAAPDSTPIGAVVRSVVLPGDMRAGRIITAVGDSALYVAAPASTSATEDQWYLSRVDSATGQVTTVKRYMPDLYSLAAGPDGLYAATSTTPQQATGGTLPRDEIERLDVRTLAVLGSEMLPTGAPHASRTTFAAAGAVLAEADDGGSVRLFDPYSLAQNETHELLSRAQVENGNEIRQPVLENPGSDGGRMWVFAGGRITALDLGTLHVTASVPQQSYRFVVPTASGLRVLGDRVGRLTDDGTITPDAAQGVVDAAHPVVAAAATDAGVLEQIGGEPTPEVLLQSGDAAPSAALDLTAAGALLGASGQHGWLLGVPGKGSAVSEVRTGQAAQPSASASARNSGSVAATTVTPQNVHSFKVGVDIAPVPAGSRPKASVAQALATCDGGAFCGTGAPKHLLLALVSTREGLSDRLAYVLQWTGDYCMSVGAPATPGHTPAPVHPVSCNLVAVVDATSGTPLFSQSGPQ